MHYTNHHNYTKPESGPCSAFNKNESEELVPCEEEGIRRYNRGVDCGIYCNKHWLELYNKRLKERVIR